MVSAAQQLRSFFMQPIIGIGGIFFKAKDPELLYQWYEKNLGLKRESHGAGVAIPWPKPEQKGLTAFAIFPKDTEYFNPSKNSFMLNFCVSNLDELLKNLKAEGVEIDPKREDADYGRFAWTMDPEGN